MSAPYVMNQAGLDAIKRATPPKTYTEAEVKALVAAALQRAKEVCNDLAVGYAKHKGVPDALHYAASEILTLIPTDHVAALEAVKAQAREEESQRVESIVKAMWGEAPYGSRSAEVLYDALSDIRAGKVQP